MRLSREIIKILQRVIKKNFGDVEVYLFGSMLDDTKKGGDIDITIKSDIGRDEFKKRKYSLLKDLVMEDFLYKVDVVDFRVHDPLLKKEIEHNCYKII